MLAAHNGDSVGPLAVVDPMRGMNNVDAILDLAPEAKYHSGCFAPYPLDERWCLVSYGPTEPFGIYLFDLAPPTSSIRPRQADVTLQSPQHPEDLSIYWPSARGRRHLVYQDPEYSCVEAMPIVARPRPPVVSSTLSEPGVEATPDEGTLVLIDVYQGLGSAVARGTVKYLRVVEEMGHRDERGERNYEGAFDQTQFNRTYRGGFMRLYAAPWESGKPAPSLQAKHVFGTVPVEADGSACFQVPAHRPVYFQALDESYNEIQRMRSYVHLREGERQSCIGCHENRFHSPPVQLGGQVLALRRAPSVIEPPPWGAGPFSYQRLVQPIFDHHCVGCHAPGQRAQRVDLTGQRDARGVPASFATLVRPRTDPAGPPLVSFFDNWWGVSTTVPVAKPLSFGTVQSQLVKMIDSRHADLDLPDRDREGIRLSCQERRVITTWIDLNCPLWDNYSPEQHLSARLP